jgi:SecD/SecF fusion protein
LQSKSPVFLIVVAVLTALSVWGFTKLTPAYGLDVKGGVRLTYSIDSKSFDELKLKQKDITKERVQADLVRILHIRVAGSLGATEANVSPKGNDQMIIEVPGYTDIDNARKTLNSTAKIIIYWAKNVSRSGSERLYRAEASHKSVDGIPTVDFMRGEKEVKFGTERVDESGNPLKPDEKTPYERMIDGWEPILEGADVANAQMKIDGLKYQPEFFFSPEGAKKMETFTKRHQEENIAFVLDGRVLQIAPIKPGTVLTDNAYIDGDFEPAYVKTLTELVKAGALPVSLKEESALKVDPTIGAKAYDQMVTAGLISMAIVAAFLLIYYAFAGLIATIGLILYVVFTVTLLMAIRATFSLAAIAALILSVGMAVDANILVFERLKEELRLGKPIYKAADLGFRHAFSAIFDSNLSTILTSAVLFVLGTGPVKGFATALIIGVLVSFFTAFAVTRSILLGLLGMNMATNPKLYAVNRNWFGENLEKNADVKPINVLGKTNLYFGISIALVVIGWIFVLGLKGLKPNVEFTGGYEAVFQVPAGQVKPSSEIISSLKNAGIENTNVKVGQGPAGITLVYITIPPGGKIKSQDPSAISQIASAAGLPAEKADLADVGATVSAETNQAAIKGVAISSLLIMLYLAIRFGFALGGFKNGIKFGGSAVIALLHDVLFVIGLAGAVGYLLGWEISSLFITAMLTVIGFSVHDTIVIFDRIRENLRKPHRGQTFEHLVNKSITQSFARSINTSFTAILTLIVLIAFGTATPDLKFMCVTMLAGITVGTYSSIFNASPILYLWDKAVMKKKGEAAGLMAESAREQAARAHAVSVAHTPTAESQYGQIKRKSAVDKATQNLDDDEG